MREEKEEGGKREKREKRGGRRDREEERRREGEAKEERRRDDERPTKREDVINGTRSTGNEGGKESRRPQNTDGRSQARGPAGRGRRVLDHVLNRSNGRDQWVVINGT